MKTACTLLLAAGAAANAASWPLVNGSFEDGDRSGFHWPEAMLNGDLALPGWKRGNTPGVYYAGGYIFHGNILLYDNRTREADIWGLISILPIAGEVAVGVTPNAFTFRGELAPPPYLEQPSLVPVEARFLWFLWKGEQLRLAVNGEPIPFVLAEQRMTSDPFVPVHDYYAADITRFAGQEATIRFEFFAHELHAFPPWPGSVHTLDDIYFSTIPEPGPATLLVVGGALLLVGRRRVVSGQGASDFTGRAKAT